MSNAIVDPRHLDILEEMLNIKVDMARKRRTKLGDEVPDDDEIETMLKVAKGVEENIKTVTSLKLKQEENDIARESNNNIAADLLIRFHKAEAERNKKAIARRSQNPDESQSEYQKQGIELNEGEVIQGKDGITYAQFKEIHDV